MMRILQISTADSGGGAEGTARDLHQYFLEQGQDALLAVGRRYREQAGVLEFPRPPASSLPGRFLQSLGSVCRRLEPRCRPARALSRILERLAHPPRFREWWRGYEEFYYPGTEALLETLSPRPDIIHCHNLHGYYFNLACLPELSQRIPLVLNLHDAWPLTGHCAQPLDCLRWQTGCGECPHLNTYPSCRRDNTQANWRRKAELYRRSRLYVTAPSQWMLDCARQSMLSAREFRLIPNSIDCRIFQTGDRLQARQRLNLPPREKIVLFVAAGNSVFKDSETLLRAIIQLGERCPKTIFLCLGRSLPRRKCAGLDLRCLPFVSSPTRLADYYRAADVFVHTSRADSFGKTITEAMACGTPVVASAVGGIPEQLLEGQTGFLVPPQNPGALAEQIRVILEAPPERNRLMSAAAARRGAGYDLSRQGQALLKWYQEIQQELAVADRR